MPETANWQRIAAVESDIIKELTTMTEELIYLLSMYSDTVTYERELEEIKKRTGDGSLL